MAKQLTQVTIDKIRPGKTRVEIPDLVVPGLYLIVHPTGKKSWAVRYRRQSDKKTRKLTLKGFPTLGLARQMARLATDKVAAGGDPASKHGEGSKLFSDVFEQFMVRYADTRCKPTTAYEIRRMFTKDALPYWGDRDVRTIGKADILDAIDRISDRGGRITANRFLTWLKTFFGWAVDRGIIELSPAVRIKAPAQEKSRDRVLTDEEIKRLWQATKGLEYPWAPFTQLLILTAQRRGEVAAMTWDELNLDAGEWNLPGSRTKNKEAHTVPLSGEATTILKSLPRLNDYVFSARQGRPISGFYLAKAELDKATGIKGWTLHDLRRTGATKMIDLGIAPHVVEAALNHKSGHKGGIRGVYNRAEYRSEKRAALEALARFVVHA